MKRLQRWTWKLLSSLRLGNSLAPLIGGTRALWKAGPLRIFAQLARLLARGFWGVIGWIAALNPRLLLQGLPALLVGVGALTVLGIAFFTPLQEVEARYWDHAKDAVKAKDYAGALACYERLAAWQNDRVDILYEMALSAEASGQLERCAALMTQLASPEHQGYGKAHLWQAIRLVSQPAQSQTSRQLAQTHLLRAIEAGVEDKEAAHGLLGDLYLNRGLLEQAEPHLLIAVKTKPQVRLRLAHLYAAQGNKTRATTEAKAVVNLYSTAAKADLFNHYARLRWAEAVTFLEDFPQAIVILEEGLSGTGEQFYGPALGRVYATWFDYVGRSGSASPSDRLTILERGLRYDPKNITLLDRLLNVTRMRIGSTKTPYLASSSIGLGGSTLHSGLQVPAALLADTTIATEAARAILRRMLAKGEAAAQVHFALGADAWDRGLAKEARLHWERAHQLYPDLPIIANNLAWLLYQSAPADLAKALDFANVAIAKAPQQASFRDTRGHIYIKMGKYREALEDLEAALPSSADNPEMHRSLAEVYSHLEMPAMAAEHQRLASEKPVNKAPKLP